MIVLSIEPLFVSYRLLFISNRFHFQIITSHTYYSVCQIFIQHHSGSPVPVCLLLMHINIIISLLADGSSIVVNQLRPVEKINITSQYEILRGIIRSYQAFIMYLITVWRRPNAFHPTYRKM